MIKNIFIPGQIGAYYIFPQRIIGINIGASEIDATQIYTSGKNIVIENCFSQIIEPGPAATYDQRVIDALKKLAPQLPKAHIYSSISSAHVIFKTLKLPFADHEKIKMVIDFEVEPLLPFSIDTSIIDFVITQSNLKDQSTDVLVAAVQKNYIKNQLQLFDAAGITIEKMTIDLICVYALYNKIPAYQKNPGTVVLLDLGTHDTQLAYIYNGSLRSIRNISKGLFDLAKQVSHDVNLTPPQTMEQIMRFGLEKSDDTSYNNSIKKALDTFFQTIIFTLNSFTAQEPEDLPTKILLLGTGAHVKELPTFISNKLNTPCSLFALSEIINNPNIGIKNKACLSNKNIISLATALPNELNTFFNLRQKEFEISKTHTANKQIIVGMILGLVILASLVTFTFFQNRSFNNERFASAKELTDKLVQTFGNKISDVTKKERNPARQVEDAINEAQQAVEEEERQWFAFSAPARASFLKYLLELSTKIDKEGLDLSIDSISITQDTLTIQGSVKGGVEQKEAFDALATLKKDLQQSKLFGSISGLKKPAFVAEINLQQNGEE